MDSQTQMFILGLLILIAGAFFGVGLQKYASQGGNSKKLLETADTAIDGLVAMNKAFGKSIIPAPAEMIISTILKVAQAGEHEAQQMFDSGQISADQRKEQAVNSAKQLLILGGYDPTPELIAALRGAAESGVFVMNTVDKAKAGMIQTTEPPEQATQT